ncbi:uncharacterized protein (TIGR02271 family) [Neolewinella xylanilytica]|uniref:Uncharacterized protein (TIGR02271 family) n=1 Tax=Neolewinella xylanilytica TaxID=1514080 RepID=A0A2S6I564_9BACT|nr:YsnF/AvaK domain-containing protein [Neolewinella xylanilytica]PPK86269.1 uncharacterized protein (TIGR02271 family) [Neolewinella xylanilytica]
MNNQNNQTVIGVFDTKSQARSAKEALVEQKFNDSTIDVSQYGEHGKVGDNYHQQSGKVQSFFDRLFGDDNSYDDDRGYTRSEAAHGVASRGTVVTVHTSTLEEAKKAASILDRYGAIDFDDRYQQYQDKSFDANRNRKQLNDRYGDVDKQETLKVLKEDVAIGKREVETGGVTVRSHVIERPVEETLRLRDEHVFVDRKPVDRPAGNADFQDRTISVKEKSEEAVVSKEARVKEEITVGKKVDSHQETVRETARETEVDVVNKGKDAPRNRDQSDIKRNN